MRGCRLQSFAVSFSCSAMSSDTILWKISTSRSAIFLYLKTSCSSFSILSSKLPSPLGPWTSLICSSPSTSSNSLGCILSSSMYKLPTSLQELSFGVSDEDMMALDPKTDPGRNSSKQNTSRKRYTDLQGSGGLYSKNFHDKRKVPGRTRVGKGRRGGQTHRAARAQAWPRRPMVARPRASPPLRFDLVIFHIFQKQQKYCSESKLRTFHYQYCYLFKVEFWRTVNLTFDESLRCFHSNNINIYIIRIT